MICCRSWTEALSSLSSEPTGNRKGPHFSSPNLCLTVPNLQWTVGRQLEFFWAERKRTGHQGVSLLFSLICGAVKLFLVCSRLTEEDFSIPFPRCPQSFMLYRTQPWSLWGWTFCGSFVAMNTTLHSTCLAVCSPRPPHLHPPCLQQPHRSDSSFSRRWHFSSVSDTIVVFILDWLMF